MSTQKARMLPANKTTKIAALALGLTVALSACASRDERGLNDPYEGINREVFAFNDTLDRNVVTPVAVAYRDTVPDPVRDRVQNVLRNMRQPIIFVNELLQGDLNGAEIAFTRFFLNSTIGLAGLHDVAGMDKRLAYREEDFGQTLAVWGVDEGPYLVVPFLGPSNPRDLSGTVVDSFGDPVTIATSYVGDLDFFGIARTGSDVIDSRSRTVEITDELRESSIDYYATIRSLYRQNRAAEISDGAVTPEVDIPEFDLEDDAAPPVSENAAPVAPAGATQTSAVEPRDAAVAPTRETALRPATGDHAIGGEAIDSEAIAVGEDRVTSEDVDLVGVSRDSSSLMDWMREAGLLR